MIRFRCKSCNQKIAARDEYSGRRLRCPKCKNVLVVPAVEIANPSLAPNGTAEPVVSSKNTDFELSFLDIPKKDETAEQPANSEHTSDRMLEDLQKLEKKLAADKPEPAEPVGKRKLPWLIDIFLYPISQPGLIILAIVIVIPLLINIVGLLLGPFSIFVTAPFFIINIVLGLYVFWYFCECIRDSAAGGVRAPDVMANAPSIGDMFFQTLRLVICVLFFITPAFVYSRYVGEKDVIYWSLLVCEATFFPMGLLAVIMFDSFAGLNPVLLVKSIFSVFFQYLGLILLCAVCMMLFVVGTIVTTMVLAMMPFAIILLVVFLPFFYLYVLLIGAHILGRFFWRYEEKLYWEV